MTQSCPAICELTLKKVHNQKMLESACSHSSSEALLPTCARVFRSIFVFFCSAIVDAGKEELEGVF